MKTKSKFSIEEIQADINSLDSLDLKGLQALENKYKKEIVLAKTGKEEKLYTYPFQLYFGHQYRDVTHIFQEGKSYTEMEITKNLITHGYKEFKFANTIEYEFFADENCLYPKLKVGNRG